MALRSYVGWLAEKARDKAVVVAAGWVDLYVVRGWRRPLLLLLLPLMLLLLLLLPLPLSLSLQPVPSGGLSAKQPDTRKHAKHNWVATWLRSHSRRYRGGRRDTGGGGDARQREEEEKDTRSVSRNADRIIGRCCVQE
ncbi:Uncharacterized protein DBV15_12872 [Temnothorax longispinosus]|uniref:Uncharacterized protein n=1 Tax=Temnothorax longispinosus TaxID=300112 RepID=A0A4S2KAF9_9HYME|nr:Uncharacterized protein DBV15_12872 [Temnothorax longispinosus]